MKKTPFLLSLLLLASCASNPGAEQTSFSDLSSETEVTSATEASSEEETRWDKKVDKLLKETLGEAIDVLPVYEASSYEALNVDDEDTGITYTTVYCMSDNVLGNEAKLYSISLVAQGFIKSSEGETITLYKQATDTSYLVLTLFQGDKGSNVSLVFYAYLSQFRYKEWPSEEIESYIGFDIPSYPGDYYYLSVSGGSLQIQVEGATSSSAEEYSDVLGFNGYSVTTTEYSGYTVYYGTPSDKSHTLTYAYDSDSSILLIQVSLASY